MGHALKRDTESEDVPIFASWGWLYGAVVAYTAVLIVILYIFTITLDLDSP